MINRQIPALSTTTNGKYLKNDGTNVLWADAATQETWRGRLPKPPTGSNPPTSLAVKTGEVWEDYDTGIPYQALVDIDAANSPIVASAQWRLYQYVTQDQYQLSLDGLSANKAVLVKPDRSKFYYSGVGQLTDVPQNSGDAIQRAITASQVGDYVYVTAPVYQPNATFFAVLIPLKGGTSLNLGGYPVATTDGTRQDAIGVATAGSGTIFGYGSIVSCGNVGSYAYTTSSSQANAANYKLLDVTLRSYSNGRGALIRSGNHYHEGKIISDGLNCVTLGGNLAMTYELVGDITANGSEPAVIIDYQGFARVRNGRFNLTSVGAQFARLGNDTTAIGTLEIEQYIIDLRARPADGGIKINGTGCNVVLTDVSVLGGSIVAPGSVGTITLRGSTTLPAEYEAAYLRAQGVTVVDQRTAITVVESATVAALPTTGKVSTLYLITSGFDANKAYRWTGTSYALVAGGLGLPDQTGSANKFLKTDGTAASWSAIPYATPYIAGIVKADPTAGLTVEGFGRLVNSSIGWRTQNTNDVSDQGNGNIKYNLIQSSYFLAVKDTYFSMDVATIGDVIAVQAGTTAVKIYAVTLGYGTGQPMTIGGNAFLSLAPGTTAILRYATAGNLAIVQYSSNSMSVGYTLPSQTGNAGKVLTTSGTSESWAAIPAQVQNNMNFSTTLAPSVNAVNNALVYKYLTITGSALNSYRYADGGNYYNTAHYFNTYGGNHYENTYATNHRGNTYGEDRNVNTYGSDHQYNEYGAGGFNLTHGNTHYYNIYGGAHTYNTYGATHKGNRYGNNHENIVSTNPTPQYSSNNFYGFNHTSNIYGSYHKKNSYGNNHSYNSYGDNISFLSCGDNISLVRIGSGCTTLRIGTGCSNCYVSPNSKFIEFGINCSNVELYNCGGPDDAGRFVVPAGTTNAVYRNNVLVGTTTGGGAAYTLPAATTTTLGGIKVGANLAIAADGTLSSSAGGSAIGLFTEITYNSSTQSYALPSNAVGVFDVKVLEANNSVRPLYQTGYTVTGGSLVFNSDANLQTGDKISGCYYA